MYFSSMGLNIQLVFRIWWVLGFQSPDLRGPQVHARISQVDILKLKIPPNLKKVSEDFFFFFKVSLRGQANH